MRRAFTLIELLVVLSIIGLLIAILLPALSGTRELAQMTQCASNQRNQGIASLAFAADSKSMLPHNDRYEWHSVANGRNWYSSDAPGFVENFWSQTEPYMSNTTAWDCPTALPVEGPEYDASYPAPPLAIMGNIFVIGVEGWGSGKIRELVKPKSIEKLKSPTDAAMYLDWGWKFHTVWTAWAIPGNVTTEPQPSPLHFRDNEDRDGSKGEGLNVVYADGHGEFLGGTDFSEGPGDYTDPTKIWWTKGSHGLVLP